MQTNSKFNNVILQFSRLLLGAFFIFSGFVKAIDPLGSAYKFEDYFSSFGGFLLHLTDFSLFFSIALSTFELAIGLNLFFAVQTRKTAFASLLLMLVMTPLTLYIAIFEPVSDCGCFGDALKISNWETFIKNLVVVAFIAALLHTTRTNRAYKILKTEWLFLSLFVVFGIGLSVYSYRNLPLIDFLPYKVGVHVADQSTIPEGAKQDEYSTTFIYEKNGQQKEFTLENYPKGDSTWTFVDQKTVLISEGYRPAIENFKIFDEHFVDIVPELLAYNGYSYLLIMHNCNLAAEKGAIAAEKIYQKIRNTNIRFYAVTASNEVDIAQFIARTGVTFPWYTADPVMLKTIIRANPGMVLMKNAVIVGKWNWRDFLKD